ncbi:MAG TPA: hypothetical protein VGT61_16105 [Thermomicrobiales bacterium]|jgi:hypothetical protein|nr:hypothetical protein [Thermomicrobiales bacterium]
MPSVTLKARRFSAPSRLLPVLLVAMLLLAGCSSGDDDPTPAPSPTAPPTAALGPATPGPLAQGTTTLTPPRVVGDLIDRIALAWVGVPSYRTTTVQGTADLATIALPGTPVAGLAPVDPNAPSTQAVIDEVVLPDQRHYLESSNGSVSEFLATDGSVYARGRYTQIAVRPDLDPTTWVHLDPTFIDAESPVGQVLAQFAPATASVYRPPLSDLQADTRALELVPAGEVTIDGRVCSAWSWTDTGDTGGSMTRTLSVDAAGLPCSLEFRSGDYASRTTWGAFGQIAPMAPPADWVSVSETIDMTGVATPTAP